MKKALIVWGLCSLFAVAGTAGPANTNIAVWAGTEAAPTAGVHNNGWIFAPYFVGDGSLLENVVGVGSVLPTAYIWIGGATSNAAAKAVSGDITITTNGVTAVASLPAISGAALTGLTAANITTAGTKVSGKTTIVSTISTTVLDFISGICTQSVTTGP